MFVHAKVDVDLTLPPEEIRKLPKKVGIVTTVQHLHKINEVKKQFPEGIFAGQVLGCRADTAKIIADKVDAFLFIGTGVFHPIEVAKTGKPIYCWDPAAKHLSRLDERMLKDYENIKKRNLTKFLHAQKVGILISTKLGQNDNRINAYSEGLKMKKAFELKERKDKEYYIFAFDTLSINDLENFPFIECWVNTACPRIADEKKGIVNIDDVIALKEELVK